MDSGYHSLMKRIVIIFIVFAVLIDSGHSKTTEQINGISEKATVYPETKLSNGIIDIHVYLPDPDKGYYRGSRFDWGGIVSQVNYQGHTYLSEFIKPHNPVKSDNTVGLSEEFGMGIDGLPAPLGYENAKPGETFVKIGVGILEKIDEPEYRFNDPYNIIDTGTWQNTHGKNWAQFVHEIKNDMGYGYHYTKRIELTDNKPELIIHHTLKNTGSKVIQQGHNNHNFILIDNKPIGKGYIATYPFEVKTDNKIKEDNEMKGLIDVDGRQLIVNGNVGQGVYILTKLTGLESDPAENEVTIEDITTGVGVKITGNYPVAEYKFFTTFNCICPELFVELNVAPGQEVNWYSSYTFFCDSTNDG